MANTVLIINGSARKGGNTDRVIQELNRGLKSNGAKSKMITLREENVNDCIGCYNCMENPECSIKDDMQKIHAEIGKANIILFASPTYFCQTTGLMKSFIDRLFLYYHPKNKDKISGKKAAIITLLAQSKIKDETEILNEFYKRLFQCLGIVYIGSYNFEGNLEKNSIERKPKQLEKAFHIGEKLATRG